MAFDWTLITTDTLEQGADRQYYGYNVETLGMLLNVRLRIQIPVPQSPQPGPVKGIESEMFLPGDATGTFNPSWTLLKSEDLGYRITRYTHAYSTPGGNLIIRQVTVAVVPVNNTNRTVYVDEKYTVMQYASLSGTDITGGINQHGGISVNGNTTATTISVQNTWYQFTGFNTNDDSAGAVPDHTNDHIVIHRTGHYFVMASISFTGGAGKTYEIELLRNNGTVLSPNLHTERTMGTVAAIGSTSVSGIITLTEADTLEMWIRCTDVATLNATLRDVTMSCYLLH